MNKNIYIIYFAVIKFTTRIIKIKYIIEKFINKNKIYLPSKKIGLK